VIDSRGKPPNAPQNTIAFVSRHSLHEDFLNDVAVVLGAMQTYCAAGGGWQARTGIRPSRLQPPPPTHLGTYMLLINIRLYITSHSRTSLFAFANGQSLAQPPASTHDKQFLLVSPRFSGFESNIARDIRPTGTPSAAVPAVISPATSYTNPTCFRESGSYVLVTSADTDR
jgi:hypothetical protein